MQSAPLLSDRQSAILSAAMIAFSRYGYSRTKMDDIARASGVARTALYKTYRNKEHIFRALCELVHTEALSKAKAELDQPGPFPQRLQRAMIERDKHLLQIGHSGPHADEFADLYLSLAQDLADASNKTLTELITNATKTAAKNGDFKLPPSFRSEQDFATLLRLGLEGVKKEIKTINEFENLAVQLIRALL